MVYPVSKVPHGRINKDVDRGDDVGREWNREKDLATTVAEDGDAQWQDVSAERVKQPSHSHTSAPAPMSLKSEQSP